MTSSFPCRSLCILAGTVAWMCANGAHALDLDVIVNIHERTIQASQACKALRRGALPATPQSYYLRGLCLAYGPASAGHADDGVAALRRAASLDVVEAQMALGDYFQASSPPRIADALYWYGRARQLGDARAAGRAAHLGNRGASATERPTPPADTIVDPAPRELQALYRQGYHCHAVFGEQWCHIADDL